ncbi:MAG: ABC transporter ATP-binding protein [Caldilineaceae bacterium]|nr:ABC transporter ATP-binding protein [Caldilineaceae bacterium]
MSMLKVENLTAGYGDVTVLRGINLEVKDGETVALIGGNGAGKTTTLRTISGLLRVRGGQIHFAGEPIHTWPSDRIVKAGLIQVAEGRLLFPAMTTEENLELGAHQRGWQERRRRMAEVYALFPRLAERRTQLAGTMSGGEQQMLAIGRGLMASPRLLMLDEPSLGLAPLIVLQIFDIIDKIRKSGTTVLIVEQNAVRTLGMADRAYVIENGAIVLGGTGQELLQNEEVRRAYLGL